MVELKKFFKRFKFAILIVAGGISLIIAYLLTKRDSELFLRTFDFFNKNIKNYSLYNEKIDKETFEKLDKIEKRKTIIEKEIKQKLKEDNKKLDSEVKRKITRQLDEFTDNEEELEEWYRNMLSSNFSAGGDI